MLMSPNATARADAVYAALAPLGLPATRQTAIANSLDAYVRGACQGSGTTLTSADLDGGFTDTGDYERWWAEATPHLVRLVTRERFPHLHAVWEAGAFEDFSDASFDYGLDRLLDGIEHHLAHDTTARTDLSALDALAAVSDEERTALEAARAEAQEITDILRP
jgi:hypothetical protein